MPAWDRFRRGDPQAVLSKVGIALFFVAGLYLRAHGVGTQLVFADEIHALDILPEHGYWYLFTHFSSSDACIPLTLYYRAIFDTVGLNELLMRLPEVVAGSATILLMTVFAWRYCGPLAGLIAGGVIAFSPYHVYLSREARPYPIVILLVLVAIMAALRWSEALRARWLWLAAAASFLAVYFHLLALPLVIALGTAVAWKAIRGPRHARMDVLGSAALFVFLCLLFLLPAVPSLLESVSARAARTSQDLNTFRTGLNLFLNIGPQDWIWQTALAGAGIYWLLRRRKFEAVLFALSIAFQVAAILILRPESSDIPWVWARYVVFALPLWIILMSGGLAALLNRIKIAYVPASIVLLLILGVCIYDSGLYGWGRNRNYLVHPMVMAHELDQSAVLASLPISNFYRKLAQQPGTGGVLEMPLNMVFPLYDLEQRVHQRPIYSAGMGSGLWQTTFDRNHGFRFKRMLGAPKLKAARLPIEYVVIHKAIGDEVRRTYLQLERNVSTAQLLKGFGATFSPETLQLLFGDGGQLQQWAAGIWRQPVYEDSDVVVYRFRPAERGSESAFMKAVADRN